MKFAGLFAYFLFIKLIIFSYPCGTYFVYSALSKCANVLRQYKTLCENLMIPQNEDNVIDVTRKYLIIIDVVHEIKNILSKPIQYIVMCIIFNLFNCIYLFLLAGGLFKSNVYLLLSNGQNFLTTGSLIALAKYCEMICDLMMKVKWLASSLITKYIILNMIGVKAIAMLERVNYVSDMSAGGMMVIDQQFLLTITGGLLTYGLLLANLEYMEIFGQA